MLRPCALKAPQDAILGRRASIAILPFTRPQSTPIARLFHAIREHRIESRKYFTSVYVGE